MRQIWVFGFVLGLISLTQSGLAAPKRPLESAPEDYLVKRSRQSRITDYFQSLSLEPFASEERSLPTEIWHEISSYLDADTLAHLALQEKSAHAAVVQTRQEVLQRELAQLRTEQAPGVTHESVSQLRASGAVTSIQAPIPPFQVLVHPVSAGLYRALMGEYPDLYLLPGISLSQYKAIYQVQEIRQEWNERPELPIRIGQQDEKQAFVDRLNGQVTKKYRLLAADEEEYILRRDCFGATLWSQEAFFDHEQALKFCEQQAGLYLAEVEAERASSEEGESPLTKL